MRSPETLCNMYTCVIDSTAGILTAVYIQVIVCTKGVATEYIVTHALGITHHEILLVAYTHVILVHCRTLTAAVHTQVIGSTAGAVIAFWMPGLIALKTSSYEHVTAYQAWHARLGGWTLIILGTLQCFAGLLVSLASPPGTHK